jgi:type III restriction enzyme
MIQLKKYQENAVNKLSEYFYEQFGNLQRRQKLIFKAPTGSGKTITMAAFLAKIVQELPDVNRNRKDIAFIWLAPFKLHEQSYQSFKRFFGETRLLNPIKFEDVQDGRLLPNDVLFVNWESVNKDSNLYVRDDERDSTLQSYVYRAIGDDTEVVIILDEAHLFATKGKRAMELLDKLKAKIEIDVSATPEFKSDYQHTIRRKEVIDAEMIKRQVLLNPSLKIEEGLTAQEGLLDEALLKQTELREAYQRLGVDINPLLLIQLPNDRAELSDSDLKIREMIVNRLGINHSITTQNGRLAVWLSDAKDKINLSGIEDKKSVVDVLLFKQAVSLGWDCPRAAVLLIFRELKQETFTIQTVGRILRMPEQKHYTEDSLNIGYVYTDLSRDMINVVADDMDYIVQQSAKRKADYENIGLQTDKIMNIRPERNRLGSKFKKVLMETFERIFDIKPAGTEEQYKYNLEQLKKRLVRIDVKELEVHLPKDVEISGDVETKQVEARLDVAKTTGELRPMFERFCYQNTGNYAPADSTAILSGAILAFGEAYFGFSTGSGEFKTMKLFLFEENRPKFVVWIDEVLVAYAKFMEEQEKKKERYPEAHPWEVPINRIYNEYYEEQVSETHILTPFYIEKNSSKPEVWFIETLEKNKESLVWWYKNGVKTQADFAVRYINTKGQWSAFYVDFVMKLQDGTIGLFDTKTLNSEPEFVVKHNALHEYIKAKREEGKKMIGGIIVPTGKEDRLWKYCDNLINNAYDTTGWVNFLPSDYLQK